MCGNTVYATDHLRGIIAVVWRGMLKALVEEHEAYQGDAHGGSLGKLFSGDGLGQYLCLFRQ